MSTIIPQAASNGQPSPQIVISTVHGLLFTVPVELLNSLNNGRVSNELPSSAAASSGRSVRETR
ncbi:hypothetical protein TBK1r_25080 [Stieleria magnilauensis]|uniref:Uncharacterized protein n=1 Tax=Stieleria magnilauensis TaxID=2527963 RepID=A0ABX5XSG7_9BACT|nr:hypothetical protein TBK1r_25080 [Planctomycetes bacterium TBK1r]